VLEPAQDYISRFNLKGADQQKLLGQLSGGERGRLPMAKALIAGGNVLLLDEPPNDLDVETLRVLKEALLESAGCVLVISHDRWFLDRIWSQFLASEGDSRWRFFSGNDPEYEEDKPSGAASARKPPARNRSTTGRSPAAPFRRTALRVVTGMEAPDDWARHSQWYADRWGKRAAPKDRASGQPALR